MTPGGPRGTATTFDIVVATSGRASLGALLERVADMGAERIVVVDDRRRGAPLSVPAGVVLLRSGGRGPRRRAQRRMARRSARWIAFLDDDVLPDARLGRTPARGPRAPRRRRRRRQPGSRARAAARRPPADRLGAQRGGPRASPLDHRRPRLPPRRAGSRSAASTSAFRARIARTPTWRCASWTPAGRWRGERARSCTPSAPPAAWVSVAKQAGNADDVLMDALHGRGWRERAGAPRGRLRAHLATTALGATALGALLAHRPRASRPRSPRAGPWPRASSPGGGSPPVPATRARSRRWPRRAP